MPQVPAVARRPKVRGLGGCPQSCKRNCIPALLFIHPRALVPSSGCVTAGCNQRPRETSSKQNKHQHAERRIRRGTTAQTTCTIQQQGVATSNFRPAGVWVRDRPRSRRYELRCNDHHQTPSWSLSVSDGDASSIGIKIAFTAMRERASSTAVFFIDGQIGGTQRAGFRNNRSVHGTLR